MHECGPDGFHDICMRGDYLDEDSSMRLVHLGWFQEWREVRFEGSDSFGQEAHSRVSIVPSSATQTESPTVYQAVGLLFTWESDRKIYDDHCGVSRDLNYTSGETGTDWVNTEGLLEQILILGKTMDTKDEKKAIRLVRQSFQGVGLTAPVLAKGYVKNLRYLASESQAGLGGAEATGQIWADRKARLGEVKL